MADNDKDLLSEARRRRKDCVANEAHERAKMMDDLRFCTLDQWDHQIRKAREDDPNGARPCLTIDKINQYIVQVVNDMRQNRPSIKVRPVDDKADVETAKIYQGLVRHIEDRSNASIAYETAGEWAVKVGLGYFRIVTEYLDDKGFEQEILIKRIPHAFSVHLGPHAMPDGSDAEYGFIVENMALEDFKRDYPGKKTDREFFDDLGEEQLSWRSEDTISVCEYFYTEYETVSVQQGERNRLAQKKSIRWCKMTGVEILQKTDWPGKFIPIVEVIGRESFVDGRRILWGLVRPAKDILRMNNYWMSALTERIGLAPKTPFVGAEGQFEGREEDWRRANTENRAYLEYKPIDVNGNALPAPQRVQPAPMEVAMVNMTATLKQDVKEALGMYKAAVGEAESQQSGRAILALQRESDTATFHFQDNLSRSIRHCGRIIVDIIPKVIDTRRIIRILGEDGQPQAVTVNPEQPVARMQLNDGGAIRSIYNLGVGEYDVSVTVGPSYTTARQEAATVLTELANSAKDPASAAVMRYLAIKNSDFYGSDEMVRMLKGLLPPALQQAEQSQIPPAILQKMQQMDQMAGMAAQRIKELESGAAQEQAKIAADRETAMNKLALDRQAKAESQLAKKQETDSEAQLAIYKARLEAATRIIVAQIAAKGSMDERLIATEHEAQMELAKAMQESVPEEQVQGGQVPAEQPQGPELKDVMNGILQAVQQLSQMHSQFLQHQAKPKEIRGTLPSGGQFNATVQ